MNAYPGTTCRCWVRGRERSRGRGGGFVRRGTDENERDGVTEKGRV